MSPEPAMVPVILNAGVGNIYLMQAGSSVAEPAIVGTVSPKRPIRCA
ncbi:MAG: hypothetical protein JMN27_07330 [gamma proteobacterium endosymbiont of Lamellibrachia anaximandri]|nr:hypothetical protein [gamma proteobacterium endosymbiont of Lamellibrachia anaximandri]MBL3533630.1 hypothetical protein [gamma proteobacterium endosymbiont of Lamellibrachia anaximandri]